MQINRSYIEKLACPESLRQVIAMYTQELASFFGDDIIGVYLYGSLARGCYNAATSDVDIIAVVRESYGLPDPERLLRIHRDMSVPVDAVFLTEAQLRGDVFPTPIDFLVKPMDGITIVHVPEGSRDFLLQRQDAYEAGVVLHGLDIAELTSPVPWPLLAECLDFLFPHIIPWFKNPVLMLCRIAYAWTCRELCSKKQAGEWALEALDQCWNPLIRDALDHYAAGSPAPNSPEVFQAFEDYCAKYIDRFPQGV